MSLVEILTTIVGLLAFVGYVCCLARGLWITIAVTLGLGIYAARDFAFSPEHWIYWGGAGGLFVAALLVLRFLPNAPAERGPSKAKPRVRGDIVIDGTNVLYWDGDPDIRTLRDVVDQLMAKGLHPFVFLDASTRHHLGDTSLSEKGFAKALGLPHSHVIVCPAKTEADEFILEFAKERGLPIVSNDRFGDRAKQAKGLKLIKGVVAGGKPMLQGF